MPQPPYAKLRVSVSGGAVPTGGIVVGGGASVQFSADPAGNLGSFLFEIYDYPPSFTCPAGWSTDANGVYFCRPTNGIAPAFNVASAAHFGKYMARLTGNGHDNQGIASVSTQQLIDEGTALEVVSLNGIHSVGQNETNQFNDDWLVALQADLRELDDFITAGGGGGGGGGFTVAGTPVAGYVPMWDGTQPTWSPAGGLSITAFAAVTPIVELGSTVVNPAFTAAENAVPTTLLLTNNADSESKDVHSTPTSFASAHSFTKSTFNQSVQFTISATLGASSASRAASITWGQRIFAGVVAAGASLATLVAAASVTTLGLSRVASFALTDDGTHKMQFACRTGYGTPVFKDAVTGFALAITKVGDFSFTNASGAIESYQQWELDNPFNGTLNWAVT